MTSALPGPARRLLEAAHGVVMPRHGTLPRDALLAEIGDAHALVTLLTDPVDESLLRRATRLQVVANYAVGYNNIDVEAASARGIVVTNTPDVLTEATADLALALLLAVARRVVEGDGLVRDGAFRGWSPELLLGADVHGATLGIVGFGRIGRAVARRARGFDMQVRYADPRRAPVALERALGARRVSRDELLAASDFVSLHCPLTDETRHYLGAAELRAMKRSAYVINTARGPLVDEPALCRALRRGWIAGAALDVFEQEPKVHPELLRDPRVVLAPHVGSATVTARHRMAELCLGSVLAVLRGERPPNVVNPEIYAAAVARAQAGRGRLRRSTGPQEAGR